MVTLGKPRLFGLALLFASSMIPSLAHGQCLPEKLVDATRYKLHFPATCTEEEKRKHSIQSKDIVEAIKSGKAVDIQNAVIQEPFTLRSITVEAEISIKGTKLTDLVDWSDATFRKVVTLDGNIFAKSADFTAAAIEKNLLLENATFEAKANFMSVLIGGKAVVNGTEFKQGASFNGAEIKRGAFFHRGISEEGVRPLRFEGAADFTGVRIGGQAAFSRAVFKHGASFNGAQVDGSALFNDAMFEGEVNFVATRIVGQADFTRAQFRRGASFQGTQIVGQALFPGAVFKQGASFNTAEITRGAIFRSVRFEGVADFGIARIEVQAVFDGAVFKHGAIFNSAQIDGSAFFRRAIVGKQVRPVHFEGMANFGGSRIGGQAVFDGAVFKHGAIFNSAQIDGSALFNGAIFEGEANFVGGRIGGQVEFAGAVFKQKVSFNSAEIKRGAIFRPAIVGKQVRPVHFEGMANFGGSRIGGQAEFDGAVFKHGAIFNSAQIDGSALFRNAIFEGEEEADFGSAQIGRQAVFNGSVFKHGASFNGAQAEGSVFFKGARLEKDFDLQGFVYSGIDVSWEDLKGRLNPPDSQVYAQLGTAFRQSGKSATASEIYYASRYVEGDQIEFKEEPFPWLMDRGRRWLVGYGQSPFRLLWFSLFLVGIGALVFRREGAVEPRKREKCPLHPGSQCTRSVHRLPLALALWVSLNAFLPGVEVMPANAWDPSASSFLIKKKFLKITYAGAATFLRVLGWIILVRGFSALPEFLLR